jgi:long-chain acyl-CoA synthetase
LIFRKKKKKNKHIQQNKLATSFWDKLIFNKTKEQLGGRVRFILSASAPLDDELAEFLRVLFLDERGNVVQGFGLTETCAGSTSSTRDDPNLGHCGIPTPSCEVKLIDVPETQYLSKNNQGEVCLRGPHIFKEYYKEPEKTKETFSKDGEWFLTGDIGQFNENGICCYFFFVFLFTNVVFDIYFNNYRSKEEYF